jgi:hypothetical protein
MKKLKTNKKIQLSPYNYGKVLKNCTHALSSTSSAVKSACLDFPCPRFVLYFIKYVNYQKSKPGRRGRKCGLKKVFL